MNRRQKLPPGFTLLLVIGVFFLAVINHPDKVLEVIIWAQAIVAVMALCWLLLLVVRDRRRKRKR